VLLEGKHFLVEDLGSANGTFINGNRVKGRQIVKSGDRLQVGPLIFRVDLPNLDPKKTDDDSEENGDPLYHFIDDVRHQKKKEIEIELDPHALDHLPEGNDFRDLLKGMDR
jgi:pSer/pThr/pTyr-binding forkhead associated (FHA) protein